ncbi:helix-turn-helix transcriptional regulator [Brevibacterium sediminis]|uniref:helix-turn-helix transcriptional regulator n=1 Tax=Brevibacterium sediminis TaxID=1857024 RepID=UPI00366AA077
MDCEQNGMAGSDRGTDEQCALDLLFGPRACNRDEFAQKLSTVTTFSAETVASLFEHSGGRIELGRKVVVGAHAAQIKLDSLAPEHFPTLFSCRSATEGTAHGESPTLQFLQLLARVPKVNSVTLRIAYSGLRILAVEHRGELPLLDTVISELVRAGVLTIAEDGYWMPSLTRAAVRRFFSTSAPDRANNALALALANALVSIQVRDEVDFAEILVLAAEFAAWEVLETLWTRHGMNSFLSCLSTAVQVYASVPEDIITDRPVLAVARSAALQVWSMSGQLGTDVATTVLPELSFELLDAPSLEQAAQNLARGDFTSDEVCVLTIHTAQTLRTEAKHFDALTAVRHGRDYVKDRVADSGEPSALLRAELDYVQAAVLIKLQRFSEALNLLQRVIRVSEAGAFFAPYPLQAAYAQFAHIQWRRGRGKQVDRSLCKIGGLSEQAGFLTHQTQNIATAVELHRSLDSLDLSNARMLLDCSIRAESSSADLDESTALARALIQVYSGRASLGAKELLDALIGSCGEQGTVRAVSRMDIVSYVCLAAGQTQQLQRLLPASRPMAPDIALVKAQISLAHNHTDEMETFVSQVLSVGAPAHLKASAHGLLAVGASSLGRSAVVEEEFSAAVEYCLIASSLMPLAQLPRSVRVGLVERTQTHRMWNELAQTFTRTSVTAEELQRRLIALPETMITIDRSGQPLSSREVALLFAIEIDRPIHEIAEEFAVVEGTMKNRLSALYKKIGVKSRAAAIAYGRQHGYLTRVSKE